MGERLQRKAKINNGMEQKKQNNSAVPYRARSGGLHSRCTGTLYVYRIPYTVVMP